MVENMLSTKKTVFKNYIRSMLEVHKMSNNFWNFEEVHLLEVCNKIIKKLRFFVRCLKEVHKKLISSQAGVSHLQDIYNKFSRSS